MDYSEPVLSGEMKESDDDEPVGDYVDMGPGVLTEWTQSRVTEEEQGGVHGIYSDSICWLACCNNLSILREIISAIDFLYSMWCFN